MASLGWLCFSLGRDLLSRRLFIVTLNCRCWLLRRLRVGWGLLVFGRSSSLPHGEFTEEPLELFGKALILLNLGNRVVFGLLLLSCLFLLPLLVFLFLQLLFGLNLLGRLLLIFFWCRCSLCASFAGFCWGGRLLALALLGLGSVRLRLLVLSAALSFGLLLSAGIPVVGADFLW